jgi:hypothetical protein
VFSVSSVSQFQRREDDAVAVSMPGQVRCYTNSRDTTDTRTPQRAAAASQALVGVASSRPR